MAGHSGEAFSSRIKRSCSGSGTRCCQRCCSCVICSTPRSSAPIAAPAAEIRRRARSQNPSDEVYNRYLVRAPQLPQHGHANPLSLKIRLNVEHLDIQPIAQGIDAVINITHALATDFYVVQIVGTGKHKVAAWGFLPAIDQVYAPCPLSDFLRRVYEKSHESAQKSTYGTPAEKS